MILATFMLFYFISPRPHICNKIKENKCSKTHSFLAYFMLYVRTVLWLLVLLLSAETSLCFRSRCAMSTNTMTSSCFLPRVSNKQRGSVVVRQYWSTVNDRPVTAGSASFRPSISLLASRIADAGNRQYCMYRYV